MKNSKLYTYFNPKFNWIEKMLPSTPVNGASKILVFFAMLTLILTIVGIFSATLNLRKDRERIINSTMNLKVGDTVNVQNGRRDYSYSILISSITDSTITGTITINKVFVTDIHKK
jgi:preprotein translocase subunit YajC